MSQWLEKLKAWPGSMTASGISLEILVKWHGPLAHYQLGLPAHLSQLMSLESEWSSAPEWYFPNLNVHRNHLGYNGDSNSVGLGLAQWPAFLTSFQVMQILLVQGPCCKWQSFERTLLFGLAKFMDLLFCLMSGLLPLDKDEKNIAG